MPMIFKGHNEGEDPMDQVATHQRLLIAAAMRTKGTILELGVGWYSTPLLHEISKAQQRHLITVDNNEDWLQQFRLLSSTYHHVVRVGWWGELFSLLEGMRSGLPFDQLPRVELVFIDQGQPIEREYAIRGILDNTLWGPDAVFVMHDTEELFAYGYERTLPMFKFKWTDKANKAWTTIASQKVNVERWQFVELPPVEPTQDIT